MSVQAAVRAAVNPFLKIYFSQYVVVGAEKVPPDGPLLVLANHPSMMMDPVPIKRSTDKDSGKTVSNEEIFEASVDVLRQGHSVLIFPEGTSLTVPHLLHLKKGALHLAAQYERTTGRRLTILPVALNYLRKDKFRSSVFIEFGEPCAFDLAVAGSAERHRAAVAAATDAVEQRLRSLLINAATFSELRAIQVATSIYIAGRRLSFAEFVRVERRFAALYEAHRAELAPLSQRVSRYAAKVDALGIPEYYFDAQLYSKAAVTAAFVPRFARVVLAAPAALLGLAVLSPLYALAKALHWRSPDVESRSMLKFLALFFLLPVINAALLYAAHAYLSTSWRVTLAAYLPAMLAAEAVHLWALEGGLRSVRALLAMTAFLLSSGGRIAELQTERRAIKAHLFDLAEKFVPSDERILKGNEEVAADASQFDYRTKFI